MRWFISNVCFWNRKHCHGQCICDGLRCRDVRNGRDVSVVRSVEKKMPLATAAAVQGFNITQSDPVPLYLYEKVKPVTSLNVAHSIIRSFPDQVFWFGHLKKIKEWRGVNWTYGWNIKDVKEMLDQTVKSKKPRGVETQMLTSGSRPLEKCHTYV